jgi:NAD(P)-dependent dehydrogenase (short-subunit alcohol dehydrogenase family)
MQMKVWLITGCSSGFGKAIAWAAIKEGYRVIVTARDTSKLVEFSTLANDQVLVTALDVVDDQSVGHAVGLGMKAFGRIDVLVNNAGYGYYTIFENLDIPFLKDEMEVNLYGMIRTSQAVLPIMRKQRSGHIINISSIAGSVGTTGRSAYSASKFAASGISDCLAQEVRTFGVNVTAVEMGALRTGFFDHVDLEFPTKGIDDYAGLAAQLNNQFTAAHGRQMGNPELAAKAIIALVGSTTPPLRIPLGTDAIGMLENRMALMTKEKDAWKSLSEGIAYKDGTGASLKENEG